MADDPASQPQDSRPSEKWTPRRRNTWWSALAVAMGLLLGLDWLLARLLWLPFYFGLFFFLVAGLIVGALAFRVARASRPLTKMRLLRGIACVAGLSTAATTYWEYRHVAATVGDPPAFAEARNKALSDGRSPREIRMQAARTFKRRLGEDFPPGGAIGYARWAIRAGEMELVVADASEHISIDHRGITWPLRTLAALLLLASGLWLSFESLRSADSVSNILAPGEEYEESD